VRATPTDRPNSAQIPDSPAALLESNREVRPPFRFSRVLPNERGVPWCRVELRVRMPPCARTTPFVPNNPVK
jgi:hypothetical protein